MLRSIPKTPPSPGASVVAAGGTRAAAAAAAGAAVPAVVAAALETAVPEGDSVPLEVPQAPAALETAGEAAGVRGHGAIRLLILVRPEVPRVASWGFVEGIPPRPLDEESPQDLDHASINTSGADGLRPGMKTRVVQARLMAKIQVAAVNSFDARLEFVLS